MSTEPQQIMDPEIEAMGQIAKALAPLEQDAIRRVLKWAIERYQPQPRQSMSMPSASVETPSIVTERTATLPRTFLSLPELFDAAGAETGTDRALVVAYWFQVVQGNADWESQGLNSELKHLGHPSTNITRDLDQLIARTPRLVLQVRKQGTTKQARKRYALSREGVRAVEAMIAKPGL